MQIPVDLQQRAIALVAAQDSVDAVLDALPDALLLLNPGGRVVAANRALLSLVRLPAEQVNGEFAERILSVIDEQVAGEWRLLPLVFNPALSPDAAGCTLLLLRDGRMLEVLLEPASEDGWTGTLCSMNCQCSLLQRIFRLHSNVCRNLSGLCKRPGSRN
ncbi:PAS domain-containing protein [Candidatus Gracilibacteria bacterium]|nr:PAS domain-containing protein [Candidatus Gracilibacteria bacterium]